MLDEACVRPPSPAYRTWGAGVAWDDECRAACRVRPSTAFCREAEREACRDAQAGADPVACRQELHRGADHKDDFEDRQVLRDLWVAENRDGLGRLGHLAVAAQVDQDASAGPDAVHLGVRPKA